MGIFTQGIRRWRTGPEQDGLDPARVEVGATFACTRSRHMVETARILSIEEDESGLPHVRYASRVQRASTVFDAGSRTLALATFLERFREPAAPLRL